MSTRYITGTIGAVIGFWIGGPQGAYYGWTIGSTLGGIADPGVIRGPSLNDLGQQTSQEGGPRPIVFALSPPMAGNIIVSGPVRKIKRRKSQGKGGPKVETEALLRTYAVGVCEGPITRFVRVWRNAELVYDARTQDEWNIHDGVTSDADIIKYAFRLLTNNLKLLEKTRFYNGTYDQNPDPALEELFGVGTTPAHRGTAYMVVEDDDLTDYRGAVPQYTFQVERCEGYFLTSRPYNLEAIDALSNTSGIEEAPYALDFEFLESTGDLMAVSLYGDLIEYEDGDPEALESSGEVLAGSLYGGLVEYEDGDPEALESSGEVLAGSLYGDLIVYEDGDPEAIESSGSLVSGTLE